MAEKNSIEHGARVLSQNGRKVRVVVLRDDACSSCHARKMCKTHSKQEMEIECDAPQGRSFSSGEEVRVVIAQGTEKAALMYGYVYPLIVLVVAVVLFSFIVSSQALVALFSILCVALYYIVLRLFGSHVDKRINIYIK
ncbi:MAG: SoxR reducing system RseC family protein [Alistipes sp.]|nr:SoxR reducing system RseC family protein [Candidatus Alistipes equi]